MENIDDKVISIIKVFSFLKDKIQLEDKLISLGIDSINMVELIIALEDAFSLEFDDSILNPDKFHDVSSLIELVKNNIK